MKRILSLLILSIVSLTVLNAQEVKISGNLQTELPVDPNVRVGVLPNGLKYYIRKNEKPEDKVELRLAVNVGSLMENEKQLGLAHFTEHMAFNGTKNFKKNELVEYLQSVGVKFGADLNAYTSFDETVYILPIPSNDPEVLNTGLQVLEDWAHNVEMTDEEIDKERGVVIEEWRLGQGANQRMRDQYFPILFKNSRYAERLPIGNKETLESFDYETVRSFYRDWYRPNLMSVVAVGDIDPEEMEKKIIEQFSKLKNPKKAPERNLYEVPNHEKTYVSIVTDKESPYTIVQLLYKQEMVISETLADYRADLIERIYNGMMNNRLNELKDSPNPPFLFASTSFSGMVRTKSVYSSFGVVGEGGIENGLTALLTENERVRKFGFTQGELDRYKMEIVNLYERSYNERDKSESRQYADEYIRAFLEKESIPGIEFEYSFTKKVMPGIKLEEVNSLAKEWITDENRVVIITGPEKEGLVMPTEEDILHMLDNAENEDISAYEDVSASAELMEEAPSPGKIVSETKKDKVGITELTLSNGATVVLKSTDFKNDEILFSAYSFGGSSLYEDKDYFSASYATEVINDSGLKEFTKTDLQKMMSGKTVSVSPYLGSLSEGLSGRAAPKDLETMFQLIYLNFTSTRKDPEVLQSIRSKNEMLFPNLMASPQNYYSDQVSKIMSQNHLRGGGIPTIDEMDKIDFDRLHTLWNERFANAGDFTFFLVGNFDIEEIKPWIETYIGGLPDNGKRENWVDRGIRPPSGKVEKVIERGEDPKSMVNIFFTDDKKLSGEEKYYLSSLGEVLTNRLIEILREEKSGVYGVGARGSASKYPYESYTFSISFPCSPDNANNLIQATYDEIKNIQKNGVTEKDMNKIKETQRISRKDNLKKNNYWLSQLRSYYYNEKDLGEFYNYEEQLEKLSSKDLQKVASKYLDVKSNIQLMLMPEK